MNTSLRYAQHEIEKLKLEQENKEGAVITLLLDFSRSEEDVQNLVGYKYFIEQLELLPHPHNEHSILEACKLSHFSYENFTQFNKHTEKMTISNRCTKEQARIIQNKGDCIQ